MYLEISGRRSGKTTRLVDAARKAISEGKEVGIYGFECSIPKDLKPYLGKSAEYQFVDEFEHNLPLHKIHNTEHWYVCGTPIGLKTKVSKRLLEISPEYKRYTWRDVLPDYMEDVWKELRTNLPADFVDREEIGLFN